jgi:hypothetical protein
VINKEQEKRKQIKFGTFSIFNSFIKSETAKEN